MSTPNQTHSVLSSVDSSAVDRKYPQQPPTKENFAKYFDLLRLIKKADNAEEREKLWKRGRREGLLDYTI